MPEPGEVSESVTEAGTSGSSTRGLAGWAVGYSSSLLADQVFFLALTFAALQVGTPGQLGLVLAAGSIPRLLILMIGGALADRRSPKRIIVATDTARAGVLAGAAAVLMVGSMTTWQLVSVALVIGALDGFFLPAVGALPARIAPVHEMGRVAALRTVAQRVALLAGGPFAGWLIHMYGPSAAFWASAALFLVSVSSLATLTLRPSPPPPPGHSDLEPESSPQEYGYLRQAGTALRLVRRHSVLPWLLLLIAGLNFGFAGPVTAGIPLLATGSQWGASGAGLLLGAFGLGAAATGVGLIFIRWIPHAGMLAIGCVVTMGAALAALGYVTTFPAALAAAVVLGLGSGVCGTVIHAMVLTTTPEAELGRVMALLSISIEGVVPLSYALTGLLADFTGARATFAVGGVIILATAALAVTRPAVRSFELVRPAASQAA